MRLGRGWAPEEESQPLTILASGLLRDTLDKIWSTYKENKNERQTKGRHDPEEKEGDEA
jgi:hypothetical protein